MHRRRLSYPDPRPAEARRFEPNRRKAGAARVRAHQPDWRRPLGSRPNDGVGLDQAGAHPVTGRRHGGLTNEKFRFVVVFAYGIRPAWTGGGWRPFRGADPSTFPCSDSWRRSARITSDCTATTIGTPGSPKADFGPPGGQGQWNQRSWRLNVPNVPFLELTHKRVCQTMQRPVGSLVTARSGVRRERSIRMVFISDSKRCGRCPL